MLDHDVSRIPLQLVQSCVVASIQVDLTEAVLEEFRDKLLQLLQRTNATGVVLDVSGVEVMDLEEFDALHQVTRMARLMGADTVFSGFQAGVVSSLVELDADISSIDAALNLDAALDMLMARQEANRAPEADWMEPGEEEGASAVAPGPSDG